MARDREDSFAFDEQEIERKMTILTEMGKANVFPSSLEYIDGDVTITDKFGVIRGTFVQ